MASSPSSSSIRGGPPPPNPRLSPLGDVGTPSCSYSYTQGSPLGHIEELGEIFVRINSAGTRIRAGDVYLTMLEVANPRTALKIRMFIQGNFYFFSVSLIVLIIRLERLINAKEKW